ncbi:MAG: HU family DNA-binding protein [Pseudomonadota bacterium]|nr:HU family DNA-binding protein [Pseudomonadota bacterium]
MRINLTKKEIINSVFMQIGFSKKMSESILEDILLDIVQNLKKYKVVKISNFGTFHIRFKKSRVGRNPKTKEEKIIKARNVVLFKPSKDFKKFINQINEKKIESL